MSGKSPIADADDACTRRRWPDVLATGTAVDAARGERDRAAVLLAIVRGVHSSPRPRHRARRLPAMLVVIREHGRVLFSGGLEPPAARRCCRHPVSQSEHRMASRRPAACGGTDTRASLEELVAARWVDAGQFAIDDVRNQAPTSSRRAPIDESGDPALPADLSWVTRARRRAGSDARPVRDDRDATRASRGSFPGERRDVVVARVAA